MQNILFRRYWPQSIMDNEKNTILTKSAAPSHGLEEINTRGTPTTHYYKPIVIAEAIY